MPYDDRAHGPLLTLVREPLIDVAALGWAAVVVDAMAAIGGSSLAIDVRWGWLI